MNDELNLLKDELAARLKAAEAPGSLSATRANHDEAGAKMKLALGVTEEPINLGGVSGLKFNPSASSSSNILYFHGGGYVVGSPTSHRSMTSHIAASSQSVVWSMDYRLGPENPFPAAVEDGLSSYKGLLDAGTDSKDIIISGDSAGGGLTVATALRIKEENLPIPAGLMVISPWTNLVSDGWSYNNKAIADPVVHQEILKNCSRQYLGTADERHPLASPIEADLSKLPPILIQVGSEEILLSDATTLAERAGGANVEVSLEVWPNMFHVFQYYHHRLQDARNAIERIGIWVQEKTQN